MRAMMTAFALVLALPVTACAKDSDAQSQSATVPLTVAILSPGEPVAGGRTLAVLGSRGHVTSVTTR